VTLYGLAGIGRGFFYFAVPLIVTMIELLPGSLLVIASWSVNMPAMVGEN
jgi:hypothetical protein